MHYLDLMDGISYMYARGTNDFQLPASIVQKLPSPDQVLNNPVTAQYSNAPYYLYLWLAQTARTPEEQIEKLKAHFTVPALIRSTTDYIIARYVTNYSYSDRFEEELARVKKMAEILPDKGERYIREMNNKKHITPGAPLPEATLENVRGEKCQLSDLKGYYLYIDFWASWCGPCRAENPNVVALYREYKDKGLTIIGVSLDKSKMAWKKAVTEDGISWLQVSDLKGWKSPVVQSYGVEGVPCTFLLDEQNRIVAVNLRGEALKLKIQEILEKN